MIVSSFYTKYIHEHIRAEVHAKIVFFSLILFGLRECVCLILGRSFNHRSEQSV